MKEESTLEMKETFTSLQEEVDMKTKKLSKVMVGIVGPFLLVPLAHVLQGCLFFSTRHVHVCITLTHATHLLTCTCRGSL